MKQISIKELHEIADSGSKVKISIDSVTSIVEVRTGGKPTATFLVYVGSEHKIDRNSIEYQTAGSKADLLAENISV